MSTETPATERPTFDAHLMRKALNAYADSLSNGSDGWWEAQRVKRMLAWLDLTETAQSMAMRGGAHLGTVRNYMQCHFQNGEHVIWGSHDLLEGGRGPRTVFEFEQLACRIAAATLNDLRGKA